MYSNEKILIGSNETNEIYILPKLANRHGIIAGATGTGKTVTVKNLAESFSDMGVPVFLADMKGDVSGLAKQGEPKESVAARIEQYSLKDKGFSYKSYPVEFWDLFGEKGLPVRVTISQIGPTLISRILNLSDVQEGALNVVFRIADDEGLLLIDLKDLKSMINHVADNQDKYASVYGSVAKQSANAILRSLLALEDQGGDKFFGEPALDLNDFMKTDDSGYGIINILDSVKLSLSPAIYSTFLLWMLSELFETLPEVGDMDKPKFVFFFDEAHLLFDTISPALLKKFEQVVKLIRSKGVGLYFISQSPSDIPDSILSQLGNRIQHALRAYTPKDQKAVKVAAETFRANPDFKTVDVISTLGTGQALISVLDEKGVPTIVEKADVIPPQSYLGELDESFRKEFINLSEYNPKYSESFDRESAYECLLQKVENVDMSQNQQMPNQQSPDFNQQQQQQNQQQQENGGFKVGGFDVGSVLNGGNQPTQKTRGSSKSQNSELNKIATTAATTIAREVSKSIVRGVLGQMKLF